MNVPSAVLLGTSPDEATRRSLFLYRSHFSLGPDTLACSDSTGTLVVTLTLYGNVDIREVQPAFNVRGHVTGILVQEGASAKRGELLATLDDPPNAAALHAKSFGTMSEHLDRRDQQDRAEQQDQRIG